VFKKILVTLDGSALAERALGPAIRLAEKFGGEVILLRVVVPEEIVVAAPGVGPFAYSVQETGVERGCQEAEAYLRAIKVQFDWIVPRAQGIGQWRMSRVGIADYHCPRRSDAGRLKTRPPCCWRSRLIQYSPSRWWPRRCSCR